MGIQVWNIDINFVVFKNQIKKKSKNSCRIKLEILGYKNTQNLLRIIFISGPQTSLDR